MDKKKRTETIIVRLIKSTIFTRKNVSIIQKNVINKPLKMKGYKKVLEKSYFIFRKKTMENEKKSVGEFYSLKHS